MSVWLNVKRVIELTRPLRDIGWSLQCIRKILVFIRPHDEWDWIYRDDCAEWGICSQEMQPSAWDCILNAVEICMLNAVEVNRFDIESRAKQTQHMTGTQ